MTLYETLGVSQGADAAAIRSAHRRAVRHNHPDRNPDDAGASERLRAAQHAYEVLSDPERRARYEATGDHSEPQNRTEHEAALALIADLVAQACAVESNPLTVMRQAIAQGLLMNAAERERMWAQMARLTRFSEALRCKGAGEDYLGRMLASQISELRARAKAQETQESVIKAAQAILADYQCTLASEHAHPVAFNRFAFHAD